MANRPRLPSDVVADVTDFIVERLRATGTVTGAEIRHVADSIDRHPRQVKRLVAKARAELRLAPGRTRPTSTFEAGSSVEAMVLGLPFTFDREMRTVAAAYAGNVAAMHRDLVEAAPEPDVVISYRQLADKFRLEVGNDTRKHLRRGIAGFKKASLYVRWSASERNETWQIDATQLDIWVKPRGTDELVRPWLLMVIDDRTRVVLSATLMLHDYNAADSAAAVHRAMRMRVVTLPDGRQESVGGIPGRILCDNALQFTGEVMTTVAQDLGFVMWAVAVYMGEKKGKVERIIRDVNEQLCMRLPGYANPNRKTLTMRDQLRGRPEDALDEVAFLEELAKWVEWKNNQPHPTVRNKSRYEVWADDPGTLRVPDEGLLRCATVPVSSHMYVFHKEGFRITRSGVMTEYLDEALVGSVGDRFHLRHLPGETRWVDAYDSSGAFVARCWDSKLLTKEQRAGYDRRRFERYRTAASDISAAVELRAIAAADPGEKAPNPLAVAHARAVAPAADDLIRASVGLPSSSQRPAELGDGEDTPQLPAGGPSLSDELADLDEIASLALAAADTDGADPTDIDPQPAPKVNPSASGRRKSRPGAKKRAAAKKRDVPDEDRSTSKEVA
jgi:transposase InsO family protein